MRLLYTAVAAAIIAVSSPIAHADSLDVIDDRFTFNLNVENVPLVTSFTLVDGSTPQHVATYDVLFDTGIYGIFSTDPGKGTYSFEFKEMDGLVVTIAGSTSTGFGSGGMYKPTFNTGMYSLTDGTVTYLSLTGTGGGFDTITLPIDTGSTLTITQEYRAVVRPLPPPVLPTITPEPASLTLLGTGVVAIAGAVRRRVRGCNAAAA